MYGLTLAAQGAVNREKAKLAAHRIFALTDRESLIDPLSDEGLQGSAMLDEAKEFQQQEKGAMEVKKQLDAKEIVFHDYIYSMEGADQWANQAFERSTEASSDRPSDETPIAPSDEEESEFELDLDRDPLA